MASAIVAARLPHRTTSIIAIMTDSIIRTATIAAMIIIQIMSNAVISPATAPPINCIMPNAIIQPASSHL